WRRLGARAAARLEVRADGCQKIADDISAQHDRQGCADPVRSIGAVDGKHLLTPQFQLPEWVEATLIRANNFERPDQLHSLETAENSGGDARIPGIDGRLRSAPHH